MHSFISVHLTHRGKTVVGNADGVVAVIKEKVCLSQ